MSQSNRPQFRVVGHDVWRVDGRQLVTGAPAFTDDYPQRGMLIGKILGSPHAHARIKHIDTAKAEALEGVHAVLTYQDVPKARGPIGRRADLFNRTPYTRAGQDYPEPSPWDYFLLDDKVRFVGDRVAAVAADTEEIALEALERIKVAYEVLPAVFTPQEALASGAPVIHDEPDVVHVKDPKRNLCAGIDVHLRDVAAGFAQADLVVEHTYHVHRVQHAQMELHTAISYFDEHDRLVVICSTQVPFHVRRQLSMALGLPIGRIRVIKPRIGGGFGGKQEMVIEDICAALTVATHRPVRMELTRHEDLFAARCRHPMRITMKTGVKREGTLTANEMIALVDAGAYGSHSPTVPTNTGNKNLPRYRCPNVHYKFDAAYTNLSIAGAMRGYGTPQGAYAIECHMDEVAEALGMDPVEFRLKTTVREGDIDELSPHIYEVKTQAIQTGWPITTCGLPECLKQGAQAIGWNEKRQAYGRSNALKPVILKGVGMACLSQGSGVAAIDTANATVKLNEDGSVNLLIGAADIGTGGDTVIAQIVAETLGIAVSDVVLYTTDTDIVPFDSGAYASSTTYVSGNAALKAAEEVKDSILQIAATLMGEPQGQLRLLDRQVVAASGKKLPLREAAMHSIYVLKEQIEHTASFVSPVSPPPFAAQFADIEVDSETGQIRVVEFVTAVDAGTIVNPELAAGQVDGAVSMGLGYALIEEMVFDEKGRPMNKGLIDYKLFKAKGMPKLKTIFVETYEPTGPYGVKAIAEIPVNGPAPAVANAVKHALGVRIFDLPLTPERVLRALGKM